MEVLFLIYKNFHKNSVFKSNIEYDKIAKQIVI